MCCESLTEFKRADEQEELRRGRSLLSQGRLWGQQLEGPFLCKSVFVCNETQVSKGQVSVNSSEAERQLDLVGVELRLAEVATFLSPNAA